MTSGEPKERFFDILSAGLEAKTWDYSRLGFANAETNRPFIEKTIKELVRKGVGRSCLVVSGGPSLMRRNSLQRLSPVIDKFVVVAADGAMGHCLRAGIVPDYVLSADPGYRIVRWFGDDDLTEEKLKDDYFRRQDLDSHFNSNEIRKNDEQLRLVNEAGPRIKALLSTSASEEVRKRCFDAGMDVYWWNPIYDDVSDENSATRKLYCMNKVPCMNTGGNIGTAALIFAQRVFQARRAVMIGMDFAYYADTSVESTQYYDQLKEFMNPAEIPHAFKFIHNPHLDEEYYTDPAYYWYRQGFLELVEGMQECDIINATEGGILFGDGIDWKSTDEVIEIMSKEKPSQ